MRPWARCPGFAESFDFFDEARILFHSHCFIVPGNAARTNTHDEHTDGDKFGQLPPVPLFAPALLSHLPEDRRSESKQRGERCQTRNLPHLHEHFHLGHREFLLRFGESELDFRVTG